MERWSSLDCANCVVVVVPQLEVEDHKWSEQRPVNGDVCDVGMSGGVNIDVMNSNVTDATSPVQSVENVSDNNAECVEVDNDDDSVLNLDDVACDKGQNVADAEQLTLEQQHDKSLACLLYTSPSPRDGLLSRMPSSA